VLAKAACFFRKRLLRHGLRPVIIEGLFWFFRCSHFREVLTNQRSPLDSAFDFLNHRAPSIGLTDSDMHIKSIKVFCDVVACSSFSKAAEENDLSQSAVSQTVQQLEEHLGVQLIDRSKRPFLLTPEGNLFFTGARKLLDRYAALEEEVRSLHTDVRGKVSIASIYSIGLHQLSIHVQRFMQANPKANVRVEYQHPDQVIDAVESGRVDMGMISYPKAARGLKATTLEYEPMLVVCAPGHRFACERSLELRALDGASFVAFDEAVKIRRELDRVFASRHVEPRIVMEFDNIETIKRAVEIDAGISLLPEPTIQRELQLGTLIGVPISDVELTRPIGIIYRQQSYFGKTAKKFIEMLETNWANPLPLVPKNSASDSTDIIEQLMSPEGSGISAESKRVGNEESESDFSE
jgi:DNA-binding transcriptional LysR family regulator